MGYTNETTHYGLPLPLGSDKTTPMDYNTSLEAVDAALFGAVSDCASFDTRLDTIEGKQSTDEDNITAINGRLTTAEGTIVTQGTAITGLQNEVSDVRNDAEDMVCAYRENSATSTHAYAVGDYFIYNDVLYKATEVINVGSTIVPDTNCTTTNVTSEIDEINSSLTKKTVSVTADGVKTYATLLAEVIALASDLTEDKLRNAYLIASGNKFYIQTTSFSDSNNWSARLMSMRVGTTAIVFNQATLVNNNGSASATCYRGSADSMSDVSSEVTTNEHIISLIY